MQEQDRGTGEVNPGNKRASAAALLKPPRCAPAAETVAEFEQLGGDLTGVPVPASRWSADLVIGMTIRGDRHRVTILIVRALHNIYCLAHPERDCAVSDVRYALTSVAP